MEKKYFIYKNDLKFNQDIDLDKSEWESDMVKDLYHKYKKRPKIELRLKDCEMENYEYLDLSNLAITDEILIKLLNLERIKEILYNVPLLDLSLNDLTEMPDLSDYPNIIYLNISNNKISGEIIDDNLKELTCENNKIKKIESKSIIYLQANNNLLEAIDVPNIRILHVNNNKLKKIDTYENLEYLECIDNQIKSLSNLSKLEELYIGSNQLESIDNMLKLVTINCVNNPIKKINYIDSLKFIICSTPYISSKYSINKISKIKNDYVIDIS